MLASLVDGTGAVSSGQAQIMVSVATGTDPNAGNTVQPVTQQDTSMGIALISSVPLSTPQAPSTMSPPGQRPPSFRRSTKRSDNWSPTTSVRAPSREAALAGTGGAARAYRWPVFDHGRCGLPS